MLDPLGEGKPISSGSLSTPRVASTFSSTSSSSTQVQQVKAVTIPESLTSYSFYETPGASATNDTTLRPGAAVAIPVVLPFRGSIVAITLSADANKSAGTATFNVRKNGTVIAGCSLTWSTGVQRQVTRFSKGTHGFVRDDYIDVVFTTNGTYAPTTTVVEVTVWTTQDASQVT